MRRNTFILAVSLLVLFFGLNSLTSSQSPWESSEARADTTVDLYVDYTTVYPGKDSHLVTVSVKNPQDSIGSYNLTLTIGYSVIGYFTHDESGDCVVETTGCLASHTVLDSCSCYTDDCYSIEHAAYVSFGDQAIPPQQNYTCLFKMNMDACCIPDSVHSSDREAMITISGQLFDEDGYQLTYRPHTGNVFIWYSVPGDANGDSIVDVGDLTFIGNYLWKQGPEPCVCEAADCDADTIITLGDQVYLINYLYKQGPAPLAGEAACWHSDCRPE